MACRRLLQHDAPANGHKNFPARRFVSAFLSQCVPKHMKRFASSLAVLWLAAAPALGQHAGDWAWKPLFEHDGVVFTYIFYGDAEARHDGVVIRLENTNRHPVRDRFKVVFRSDTLEREEEARGHLQAGEIRTGGLDSLYWVPFAPGTPITEVGLRGYRITPVRVEG